MREIKFRVWDKEQKRFCISVNHISIDVFGNVYNLQSGEGGNEIYELNQFTGLKDRNGKEIYEGDVIKHYNGIIIIEYDCDVAGYNICYRMCESVIMTDDIVVIGNIYENPELL